MIIIDTNVVSEIIKHNPDPPVVSWLTSLTGEIAITSVTAAELFAGVYRLPEGLRKQNLQQRITQIVASYERNGAVLPFDQSCAKSYASFKSLREHKGRPVHSSDAFIAAIAMSSGSALATRNIRDFEGVGIQLINPWDTK